MKRTRIITREIFTQNTKLEKPLTIDEMREKLDINKWHSVSVVITFFEKLGILLKNDYLDKELTRSLFEYDFNWWYSGYIEKFVKIDDKLEAAWSQSIEYVNLWFKNEKR